MPVSERDFQAWIIEVAERFGWKAYHFHDSRRQVKPGVFVGDARAAGVADLFLLHADPPRLIIAEVKGTGGKLSDAQREFLKMARDVAEQTWTPSEGRPTGGGAFTIERKVGVYVFEPGQQDMIEAMLRTRVLP